MFSVMASLWSEVAEPISRRYSAIHEEVAAGDECTIRPHQESANGPNLIRGAGAPGRGQLDHAPVSLAARTGQLVLGERREDYAWADRVDPRPRLPQRTASAITRSEFPRLETW